MVYRAVSSITILATRSIPIVKFLGKNTAFDILLIKLEDRKFYLVDSLGSLRAVQRATASRSQSITAIGNFHYQLLTREVCGRVTIATVDGIVIVTTSGEQEHSCRRHT